MANLNRTITFQDGTAVPLSTYISVRMNLEDLEQIDKEALLALAKKAQDASYPWGNSSNGQPIQNTLFAHALIDEEGRLHQDTAKIVKHFVAIDGATAKYISSGCMINSLAKKKVSDLNDDGKNNS